MGTCEEASAIVGEEHLDLERSGEGSLAKTSDRATCGCDKQNAVLALVEKRSVTTTTAGGHGRPEAQAPAEKHLVAISGITSSNHTQKDTDANVGIREVGAGIEAVDDATCVHDSSHIDSKISVERLVTEIGDATSQLLRNLRPLTQVGHIPSQEGDIEEVSNVCPKKVSDARSASMDVDSASHERFIGKVDLTSTEENPAAAQNVDVVTCDARTVVKVANSSFSGRDNENASLSENACLATTRQRLTPSTNAGVETNGADLVTPKRSLMGTENANFVTCEARAVTEGINSSSTPHERPCEHADMVTARETPTAAEHAGMLTCENAGVAPQVGEDAGLAPREESLFLPQNAASATAKVRPVTGDDGRRDIENADLITCEVRSVA